jgi:hypothetical protein
MNIGVIGVWHIMVIHIKRTVVVRAERTVSLDNHTHYSTTVLDILVHRVDEQRGDSLSITYTYSSGKNKILNRLLLVEIKKTQH